MAVITAAAIAAAGAWIFVLLSPASDRPLPSPTSDVSADSPMTTLASTSRAVPSVAAAAGQSMVQLQASTSHGTVLLTGVAVAEGGLVATTADALSGLRSISMVGTDGHLWRSSVMGIDRNSDIALITVPDDVPVAPFADDSQLNPGSSDMTLTLAGSGNGVPVLHCDPGSVDTVGNPLTEGPADGMPAIVSTAPGVLEEAGDPLLNTAGAVVGLLYDDDSGSGGTSVSFLPSDLVLGVTDDLRSTDRVAPGWLGVAGTTVTAAQGTTQGAAVMAVTSNSPAAGVLQPGDVIVGVNATPVRTMAELRARLYILGPHAPVALSVVDGATTHVVDVTLGASP
jgi:S1-C subfamily serine protease